MSDWFWTWGGESFGYVDDDALYTYDGRHVGFVERDEDSALVFSIATGEYLGEFGSEDRLITKQSRMQRHRRPRRERLRRAPRVRRAAHTERVMRVGYEDFPSPDAL